MSKPKIVIVDDHDNIIGHKYREEFDPSKDYYRCTGIWVTNSQGEILIAQRKFTKKHDPGKWGPAVAGTVDEGETYESNAYKVLEEEIGITGVKLEPGPKTESEPKRKYFSQWYLCTIDKPAEDFKLQEEEVEKVKWVTKEWLLEDVKNNPENYVPSLPARLKVLIK